MKKIFALLCALTSLAGTANAAAGVASASFTDKEGVPRTLRSVRAEDFANPIINKDFSPATLADRQARMEANVAGIFVVESVEGAIVGRVVAGGMPLGYQPWPATSADDIDRSNKILSFYKALLKSVGVEPAPTRKHRVGADIDLVHINPDVLALTVVLGGAFSSISAQEAVVSLVRANGTMVPRDPGVTEPTKPLLCLSITQTPGLASTAVTKVYPGLPYYPLKLNKDGGVENDGLYYAVVTAMDPTVVLPEPVSYPIEDFAAWYGLPLAE